MTASEILTLHHLRKTPTRIAIVQNLLTSGLPLSENDIREKMQDSYERITFYRTIQTLMEAGIIHRIIADNTTVRYALNHCTSQQHKHQSDHVHFYCTQCGRVECLKEIAVQQYFVPDGYRKDECEVMIKGICKQCSERNIAVE
ncbi:MAG: transcriptional repressor [Bacteroidales bacterium]|nr:transcriptional repressor [Bacteroidales bacterium]